MLSRSRILAATAAAIVALAGAAATNATAAAGDITPGVMTFTEGAQCTANFVFTDGKDTFIGQAAHCSGMGAATDTNGCEAESLPLGTK
ncbi:MAG: serine protease, partial [Actinomycetota bacterium]|nr:serine protease [Actinomycetota bacterium]